MKVSLYVKYDMWLHIPPGVRDSGPNMKPIPRAAQSKLTPAIDHGREFI